MSDTKTKLGTVNQLTELALEAFCDDISTMFGIGIDCEVIAEPQDCKFSGLRKKYRKISALFKVKSEGPLDGEFWILLDQEAFFVLSGIFVMLPERIINEKCKSATIEDARASEDAMGEVGNLMVGSWDRIFRESFEGHKHFVQSGTTLFENWPDVTEAIALDDDSLDVTHFQIEVEEYPSVNCAVIYPHSLVSSQDSVESVATETETSQETVETQETFTEESTDQQLANIAAKEDETTADQATQAESEDVKSVEESSTTEEPDETERPQEGNTIKTQQEDSEATADSEKDATIEADNVETVASESMKAEQPSGPVSEAIHNLTNPSIGASVKELEKLCEVKAVDLMDSELLWIEHDATVEQTIAKMQQANTCYAFVGNDGIVEGIVSRSDIRAAMSPYLQAMFIKWRRPLDLATMQIKVKWILSSPVQTINENLALPDILKMLYENNGKCLPIVNNEGKAVGKITMDEILALLLRSQGQDFGPKINKIPLV